MYSFYFEDTSFAFSARSPHIPVSSVAWLRADQIDLLGQELTFPTY